MTSQNRLRSLVLLGALVLSLQLQAHAPVPEVNCTEGLVRVAKRGTLLVSLLMNAVLWIKLSRLRRRRRARP